MTQPPGDQPGRPAGPPPGMANAPTQHLPAVGSPTQPQQRRPQQPQPQQPQPQQPQPQQPQPPAAGHEPPGPPGPPAGPTVAPARPGVGVGVLALVSLVATVVGLSVTEDGHTAWHVVHAWGALAIAGAVLTFAPLARTSLNLTTHRAWQAAACGAGALALFWVLFVLPAAGSNTSLLMTVGAAAGIVAAWVAPGRDEGRPLAGSSPSGGSSW